MIDEKLKKEMDRICKTEIKIIRANAASSNLAVVQPIQPDAAALAEQPPQQEGIPSLEQQEAIAVAKNGQ